MHIRRHLLQSRVYSDLSINGAAFIGGCTSFESQCLLEKIQYQCILSNIDQGRLVENFVHK